MASKRSLRRISLYLAAPFLVLLAAAYFTLANFLYIDRKSNMIQIVGGSSDACQVIDESGPNFITSKPYWLNLQCTALVDVRGREKWTKDSNADYATLPGSEIPQPYDPGTLECFLSVQYDPAPFYLGSVYRACRAKYSGNWKVAVYWYDGD